MQHRAADVLRRKCKVLWEDAADTGELPPEPLVQPILCCKLNVRITQTGNENSVCSEPQQMVYI